MNEKTRAIVVSQFGGPEVLEWQESELPSLGPTDVLVRHTAVGLNFIDVYHRTGLYPLELPFTPGVEAAGIIEAVGSNVDDLGLGERVAYTGNGPPGSYSEKRILPRTRLARLPDAIDDHTAAAIMLKGCTVEYLVTRTFPISAGDVVLLHAAAGGVGLIASQWLSALGARVIGTVGSEEKGELAQASGCDEVILYRVEDVADRVREMTDGQGVDVVYDSVGAATFEASIKSLRPRGMMVTFGNASGPVPPVPPLLLSQNGSLFLTRPGLAHYYNDPAEAAEGIAKLFDMVLSGKVTPHIGQKYPLSDVPEAHRDLENRQTVGSTVLAT
tara:strand:+ start:79192 stop:80178 length:987 start_codon:yes stop_codon:yes gene_type:complete